MTLGGVLINVNNLDEPYNFNLHAVLRRPNDPLANAQFAMTYLGMGKLQLAEKYLLEAHRLDPAHFSNPQLYSQTSTFGKSASARPPPNLRSFSNTTRIRPPPPKCARVLPS